MAPTRHSPARFRPQTLALCGAHGKEIPIPLVRWIGAALLEARRGFRRLRGYRDIQKLRAALLSTTRTPKTEFKVA